MIHPRRQTNCQVFLLWAANVIEQALVAKSIQSNPVFGQAGALQAHGGRGQTLGFWATERVFKSDKLLQIHNHHAGKHEPLSRRQHVFVQLAGVVVAANLACSSFAI
eukprot:gnl/TRDRNA2_/TRDRNA2_170149_c0_seq2.p2 gnl/TRDRNA2_/TRDRNA2_170149_c0~~gnl/TRDRNA2_/TRDRNA2_170149_c0_seq2.p2  ORF type:complete len:107 (+),score=3.39 gnl/TRDRNA2_/TRDRNA2_170149_c0_seq2:676-996(+)